MAALALKTMQMHVICVPEYQTILLSTWGGIHDVTMRLKRDQAQELLEVLTKLLEKENG
jgi:hypothetical protein